MDDKQFRRLYRRWKVRQWFVGHHLWPRNKMEKLIKEFSDTTRPSRPLTKEDMLAAIAALEERDKR